MEQYLTELYSNSVTPVWSAFLLGLLTAISPCPLATNITALGFVSKDINNRQRVFLNGLIYTLGRALSYTLLAALLIYSAEQFAIASILKRHGEKFLGSLLILVGLFMLGILHLKIPGFSNFSKKLEDKQKHSYWDVFLLGILFALAFCPYSGILYFGMLIPLSIEHSSPLLLPLTFALATGIPVIIFAWLLAYAFSRISKVYQHIQTFEFWFRKVLGILFIAVGVYYCALLFF